ncbi:MAG: hypothetical protein K2M91_12565 [Lachnospiraceae bacterium]|nr:hypothetical protein [Lachnospiraceae bacterium]
MGRIEKKWTGSLLLILLIFFGMCFGNTNTDSFIMDQTAHQELSHNETIILKSYSSVPCTVEMLNTYNVIDLMNDTAKRSGDRINRSLLILLLVDVVLQIFSGFSMTVNRAHVSIVCNKTVVLKYIHNKDGKK